MLGGEGRGGEGITKTPEVLPAVSTACTWTLIFFFFFNLEPRCPLGPGAWMELLGGYGDSCWL